jgi:hypothetical protein
MSRDATKLNWTVPFLCVTEPSQDPRGPARRLCDAVATVYRVPHSPRCTAKHNYYFCNYFCSDLHFNQHSLHNVRIAMYRSPRCTALTGLQSVPSPQLNIPRCKALHASRCTAFHTHRDVPQNHSYYCKDFISALYNVYSPRYTAVTGTVLIAMYRVPRSPRCTANN